jgi:two-component system sensor histidine kinase UhpB
VTLRQRLVFAIAAVLVISLALGGALTYRHAVAKLQTEMHAALIVGENTIRHAIESALPGQDPNAQLLALVSAFDGERHLRLSLIRSDGQLAARSSLLPPPNDIPDWFYHLIAGEKEQVRIDLPSAFVGKGQLILETDSRNEADEVWGDLSLSVTILAMFCLLVLGLVYLIVGHALRPLERMSSAFVKIGRGDYDARVPEAGPTELARLGQGFNRMTADLSEMQEQNRRLHEQLLTVQEEERADIARDLHDEIGSILFGVDVDAASIREDVERRAFLAIPARADAIRESIGHMQKHVRGLLNRLRPAGFLDLGLGPAVEKIVAFWQARHPEIAFEVDVAPESFGAKIDRAIHRVVQESVSNAVRHGRPSHIAIDVARRSDGAAQIAIRDDGAGLGGQSSRPGGGFGVAGMKERVQSLGGTIELRNRPDGSGAEVAASIPAEVASGLLKAS